MTPHPTDFLLDRHALGEDLPEVAAHVAHCERCAGQVREVTADPGPMPPELVRRTRAETRRPWRLGAIAGLAMAAALLLAVWVSAPDPIRPKGAPSVQLWTLTDGGTERWTGRPLSAGTRVRLWVDPGDHDRVSVTSGGTPLYAGPVDGPGPLPVSWTLDDAPTDEVLDVRLSGGPDDDQVFRIDIRKVQR